MTKWIKIFDSKNPKLWNIDNLDEDSFSISLDKLPEDIKYVKITNPNGQCVILPMTREGLNKDAMVTEDYGWAGANRLVWSGFHLGIYDAKSWSGTTGDVHIVPEGGHVGWGFGNGVCLNNGQYYAWDGVTIPPCKLEISAKCFELNDEEKKQLLNLSKKIQHFYQNIQGWFDYEDLYKQLCKELPNNFTFAEIGVWKGRSLSFFVVEAVNSNKNFNVFAVDTFGGSEEHVGDPILSSKDGLYNHFLENIRPIKNHVKIIRENSKNASKFFDDNYFDAIFIDAAHDYESVISDLNDWAPKVKKENFAMYGHDIGWPGVGRAVLEYSSMNNLKLEKVSNSCWKISK